MIITLSEKRNEKLVFDWGDEITEQHAQDFCDVCNVVFEDNYTVPYILERFGVNIYGAGYICIVYKDDKPVGVLAGIRNDLDGNVAFQGEHFATLPEARKGGYPLDMDYYIHQEVGRRYPGALIYGFPNDEARAVGIAGGSAHAILYQRIYCGATKDFRENIPFISDDYAEAFTLKKKKAAILQAGGKCYAVFLYKMKKFIPAGIIIGEVSSKFIGKVPSAGKLRFYRYFSRTKGVLGLKNVLKSTSYKLGAANQDNNPIPPAYKTCHNSSDFFANSTY